MRIVTDEQGAELVKRLQGHGECRVLISHMPNNLNSHMLAHDFYDVLLQSGWQVDEPSPMDLLSCDDVQVGVSDCTDPPQCARLLHDSLMALGLRTPGHLVRGQGASLDRCRLLVGTADERPKIRG